MLEADKVILHIDDHDGDTITVRKDTFAATAVRGLILSINENGEPLVSRANCVLLNEEEVRKLTSTLLTWLHIGDG